MKISVIEHEICSLISVPNLHQTKQDVFITKLVTNQFLINY